MGLGDSSPTQKLYVASANALVNGSSFDRPSYIALDTGDMSGFTAATNALATETTGAGLVRAGATLSSTTTTVEYDTCKSTYTFTCSTSASITGHVCASSSSKGGGNLCSWYCYAATVPLTNGDTLACTTNHQYLLGV
jgi:hypothetical protein